MEEKKSKYTEHELDLMEDLRLELRTFSTEVAGAMLEAYEERWQHKDEETDNFEQRLAMLSMAYGELALLVEAILVEVSSEDEETAERFKEKIAEGRKQLISMLITAQKAAEGGDDSFVTHPTPNMEGFDKPVEPTSEELPD